MQVATGVEGRQPGQPHRAQQAPTNHTSQPCTSRPPVLQDAGLVEGLQVVHVHERPLAGGHRRRLLRCRRLAHHGRQPGRGGDAAWQKRQSSLAPRTVVAVVALVAAEGCTTEVGCTPCSRFCLHLPSCGPGHDPAGALTSSSPGSSGHARCRRQGRTTPAARHSCAAHTWEQCSRG